MTESFGPHLTIDGYNCNHQKLKDFNFVYDFLNNLPKEISMQKMTLPFVVKWRDKGSAVDGVSGFVMIAESHIAIHTFPQTNYLTADIYSCKKFDVEKAISLFIQAFEIKVLEKNIVERGRTIKAKPLMELK